MSFIISKLIRVTRGEIQMKVTQSRKTGSTLCLCFCPCLVTCSKSWDQGYGAHVFQGDWYTEARVQSMEEIHLSIQEIFATISLCRWETTVTWSLGSNREATLLFSIFLCHLSSLSLLFMLLHTLTSSISSFLKPLHRLCSWLDTHFIWYICGFCFLFLEVSVQMSPHFHVLHEHFSQIALFFTLSLLAACKFLQSTCYPLYAK